MLSKCPKCGEQIERDKHFRCPFCSNKLWHTETEFERQRQQPVMSVLKSKKQLNEEQSNIEVEKEIEKVANAWRLVGLIIVGVVIFLFLNWQTRFIILLLLSFIALIIGLIQPKVFSRFFKTKTNRKFVGIIFGASVILFFILFGITSGSSTSKKTENSPTQTASSGELANKAEEDAAAKKKADEETAAKVAADATEAKAKADADAKAKADADAAAKAKADADAKAKAKTVTTPVTTQTPTQTTTPSSETISQKNAVAKAKSYLGISGFSHDGLVAQLEYEQFAHADAVYGADNSGANWNEQAAKKAKSYMEISAFSRGSLITQLEYEKFTQAQAEYGANSVGL